MAMQLLKGFITDNGAAETSAGGLSGSSVNGAKDLALRSFFISHTAKEKYDVGRAMLSTWSNISQQFDG